MIHKDSGKISFAAAGDYTELYIPEIDRVGFTFVGDGSNTPQYRVYGGRYDETTDILYYVLLHDTGAFSTDAVVQLDMTTYTHGKVELASSGAGGALYYCRTWWE